LVRVSEKLAYVADGGSADEGGGRRSVEGGRNIAKDYRHRPLILARSVVSVAPVTCLRRRERKKGWKLGGSGFM
jgi:hypothetical protein